MLQSIDSAEDSRIVAVVPKKIEKTAVGRNKLRRRMYTLIHPFITQIKLNTHSIIFAKSSTAKASKPELIADIKNIFVKAKILG